VTLAEPPPEPTGAGRRLRGVRVLGVDQGLTLYPAQEEALLEVVSGNHVILSTPTGSGKSMVAAGAQFWALSQGSAASTPRRSRRW
jgi:superfamily II DNA or RNA helicase